jgi:hypothetical protein
MRTPLAQVSLRSAALSVLTLSAFLAAPALAETAAYVGTWSTDAAQCNTPQEQDGAPMVVAPDRYDQHETHCTFTSVEGAAPDWKIKADCSVEGNTQPAEFGFTVSGDTLTITDAAGARDLLRCP